MGKKGIIGLAVGGVVCLAILLILSTTLVPSSDTPTTGQDSVAENNEGAIADTITTVAPSNGEAIPVIGDEPSEQSEAAAVGTPDAGTVDGKPTAEPSSDEADSDDNKKSESDDKTAADDKKNNSDKKNNGSKNNNKNNNKNDADKVNNNKSQNQSNNNAQNNDKKDDSSNVKNPSQNNTATNNNINTNNPSKNDAGNTGGSSTGGKEPEKVNKTYKSTIDGLTVTSKDSECTVSGNKLTISKAGTYILAGKLSNGQIIVEAAKTEQVTLVLQSASLSCSNSAPIYVKSADEVTIQLAAGTRNTVTDGAAYTFAAALKEPDAAIFSEEDLNFEGTGSLTVTGKYLDGIASKNDIKIKQGTISVTANDDGIRGKDGIEISGGSVSVITTLSHALKTTELASTGKGIVHISGGTVRLDAVGDGIHATNQIKVTGGDIYIDAKNEGLDTDASFVMTGGKMVIDGTKSVNHSIFDCPKGATVNGGTFFAVGNSTRTKPLSTASTQKTLYFKAGTEQETETTVTIENSSGKQMFEHKATRKYQCVLYSSPELKADTYTIFKDKTKLGTTTVE